MLLWCWAYYWLSFARHWSKDWASNQWPRKELVRWCSLEWEGQKKCSHPQRWNISCKPQESLRQHCAIHRQMQVLPLHFPRVKNKMKLIIPLNDLRLLIYFYLGYCFFVGNLGTSPTAFGRGSRWNGSLRRSRTSISCNAFTLIIQDFFVILFQFRFVLFFNRFSQINSFLTQILEFS